MSHRHGIMHERNQTVGLFGVWGIFEILVRSPFRTAPLGTAYKPVNLAFHFRQALRLLFYSLDVFQQKSIAFNEFLEEGALAGPNPGAFSDIQTEANAAAQGILSNLNIVLDDITRIIPFVLFTQPTKQQQPAQGFLQFKKHRLPEYPNTPIVARLRALFGELDDQSSWFQSSIEYGIGMRQRLSHYTDLIVLSASAPPGENQMRQRFELVRIGTSKYTIDFPAEPRNLLHGLCAWLDKLDCLLIEQLCDRAKESEFEWQPPEKCPGLYLPVVGTASNRDIPKVDYLYLPTVTSI